jgi:carbon-monoxide dehydrogenase large subunit
MTYSGQPIKRVEDHRLLTGQSSFVDDLKVPGMLHASVLRSPHAHAKIKSIDTVAASSLAGVVSVITAAELTGAVRNVPTRENTDADELRPPEHPVLARDKVCYVGQPVAIIVAEDLYLAHDALELVQVDYQPLPSVINPLEAMAADAPVVHTDLGTNIALHTINAGGDLHAAWCGSGT